MSNTKIATPSKSSGIKPPRGLQSPYTSPVLEKILPSARPKPSPACEDCPQSLWFATQDELKCRCSRMHLISWTQDEPPIMACDGREFAVMELLARMAEEAAAAAAEAEVAAKAEKAKADLDRMNEPSDLDL